MHLVTFQTQYAPKDAEGGGGSNGVRHASLDKTATTSLSKA